MSLTLEAEQQLGKVGLIRLFTDSRARWTALAQHSYDFVKGNFPDGAAIRQDDVTQALRPLLFVDDTLVTFLNREKLRQKYWFIRFGDLILDRTWNQISAPRGGNNA